MDKNNQKKGIYNLQIPNEIITDRVLKHEGTFLYVIIKSMSSNKGNSDIYKHKSDYSNAVFSRTGWRSFKTFKKYLRLLEGRGYIKVKTDITKLRRSTELEIELYRPEKNFTGVDVDTLNVLYEIGQKVSMKNKQGNFKEFDLREMVIKYYYYLEKNYNSNYGYSFPKYEDISKVLGISEKYIKPLNDLLEENGLLEVLHGKKYFDEFAGVYKCTNNMYQPLCKGKEFTPWILTGKGYGENKKKKENGTLYNNDDDDYGFGFAYSF